MAMSDDLTSMPRSHVGTTPQKSSSESMHYCCHTYGLYEYRRTVCWLVYKVYVSLCYDVSAAVWAHTISPTLVVRIWLGVGKMRECPSHLGGHHCSSVDCVEV